MLCKDGSYYTGYADEPIERLARHSKGLGAKYTKKHKPQKIVWTQLFKTEKEARKREKQIKRWTRKKKEKLIKGEWN